jgi:3-phosphoshikimate 1-carboxyvinyltransferase
MVSEAPVEIDDGTAIGTSFPGFAALMNGLGARILPVEGAS